MIVGPHETVRVIARLGGYADLSKPYMFHCHILEHEDMGMMGQYVVVDDLKRPVKIDSRLEGAAMRGMTH